MSEQPQACQFNSERCETHYGYFAKKCDRGLAPLRAQVEALRAQLTSVGHVPYLDRMKELADQTADALEAALSDGLDAAMNRFNTAPASPMDTDGRD